MSKIGVASDHAGYDLKVEVSAYLRNKGFIVVDYGCNSNESCDYADYAHPLAYDIEHDVIQRGIAICGSANGITITLNKHQGIRAAICWLPKLAQLAREHNDANVCSLPARFIDSKIAIEIINDFLQTRFTREERHIKRISKIAITNDSFNG